MMKSRSITKHTDGAAIFKIFHLSTLSTLFASTLISSSHLFADANTHQSDNAFPIYTIEQAGQGKIIYTKNCATCHGNNLNDGGFATPITGDAFYSVWGGRSANDLLQYIRKNMPKGLPGSLSDKQYVDVLSYMFQVTGLPSGNEELRADIKQLSAITLPLPSSGPTVNNAIYIPPAPNPRDNPLDRITPVTDEMLIAPPDADWLMWRRTYDAHGYSPLKQITTANVNDLKVVWSWNMPEGRNVSTPLVHDGVMFMYGFGSLLYAFNAQTGDLLWRYEPEPKFDSPRDLGPRAISIYKNTVILTTDNGNVSALDVKTGEVVWDTPILNSNTTIFSSGSLVADGKVVLGTTTNRNPGKNFVVALDADTGEEKWRFYTIEKPGGNSDTWNGISADKRQGAGIYVPGSYDPESKLVYFGTANTYEPQLLSDLKDNDSNNDGLYTNSTLALDINTGKLAWHFQHLANDQWNYDWAFERTISTSSNNGTTHKSIITGGKQAIFDSLHATKGSYLFSLDLGLQNMVKAINPISGKKEIAPEAYPTAGETRLVCPDAIGARTWRPTALNPDTKILYIPYREACMKIRNLSPGDIPHGNFGQNVIPRPDSDGNFGGLSAYDLTARKNLWTHRYRTVPSTGVLATAGRLLFYGSRDRVFSAHDSANGDELWRVRLNSVPNGTPISFMIEDRQYIAVTTGEFGPAYPFGFAENDKNPRTALSTIWVFELSSAIH
ncbi:PQQ-binding-like beta-propeller repeat protein [Microbulbifer sp. ZKSA006]|uniref:outer membrane protein assembly factor BamB family protein n=1 Tax=Microbulbifer sp. ZKSA006 TaxID=3243390 RepID=UPI00403940CA